MGGRPAGAACRPACCQLAAAGSGSRCWDLGWRQGPEEQQRAAAPTLLAAGTQQLMPGGGALMSSLPCLIQSSGTVPGQPGQHLGQCIAVMMVD